MTPKQIFELKTDNFDKDILNLHPNNHNRRRYIRSIVTDELIVFLYVNEQLSANAIVKYFKKKGIEIGGAGVIINRLKNQNLDTRNIKETCCLTTVQESKTNTLLSKYGVLNISQIPEAKEKKAQQCLAKYGVTNNFKAEEIKQKTKKFWIENYGVEHPSELGRVSKRYVYTKPHKLVIKCLEVLGIYFETETNTHFKAYNPILQKRFCPRVDIFIPNKKLVIEVYGTYWHADPKLYKSSDIFYTFRGPMTAEQIWFKDKIRVEHLKTLGYNVEIIWDNEITLDIVKNITDTYEDCKN